MYVCGWEGGGEGAFFFFFNRSSITLCVSVVNTQLANMWSGRNSNGFMQGLHFTFGFGAVLSPVATQPFLAPSSRDTHLIPIEELELALVNGEETERLNYIPANDTFAYIYENVTVVPTEEAGRDSPKETKVFYALLISGILCLICASLMIVIVRLPAQNQKQPEETDEEGELPDHLRKVYYAAIVMLGVYNFFGSSVEDVFSYYLMTFVVRELDWSKTSGAHLTSVFWVGFSAGRLSGVGLVRVLRPTKIILGCLTSMIVSLLALMLAALFKADWAVWIAVAAMGLSVSVLFPTGMGLAAYHFSFPVVLVLRLIFFLFFVQFSFDFLSFFLSLSIYLFIFACCC